MKPPTGRTPHRVFRVAACAALLTVALRPGGLAAQETDASGADGSAGEVSAFAGDGSAFVGVLAPLSRLTRSEDFETEVSAAPAVGLEVGGYRGRVGVSVQGFYAPARLSLFPGDFAGALPEDLGAVDYFVASAAVRYRFPSVGAASAVRPYLALGGGVRRLEVQPIASPEVRDATDPLLLAGAGAHVRLGEGVDVRFEFRDHASTYRDPETSGTRLQNDLTVSVGLALTFR